MGGSRRLIIVLVAGLLFSFAGAAVIKTQEKLPTAVLAATHPTTTVTTLPPTTTTTAVPFTRPSRPVSPREPVALEPIVELGTIEIPKIGLSHKIMHGISMRNIDLGPSHWPGTAMPGDVGNTVFAGHRVTKTRPFLRIDELAPDDLVIFRINGLKSTYRVTGSSIVFPDALEIVDQTATPTGTLFACHPKGSARQRYVVHLALVDSVLDS